MIASMLGLAIAVQEPPSPPIVVQGEKPAEQRKVCSNRRETGSRVVKMVCRTSAEQKQLDTRARNTLKMGNRSPNPPENSVPPPAE